MDADADSDCVDADVLEAEDGSDVEETSGADVVDAMEVVVQRQGRKGDGKGDGGERRDRSARARG